MLSSKRPVTRNSVEWPMKSEDYSPRQDPWKPIVLALDGGGIRGLSSLFILKHLMTKISDAESTACSDGSSNRASDDAGPRLPCHYFDFIVGTSTGGLIAVMLGRLRMTVDDCIKEYMKLGSYVFSNRRWLRLTKYDHRRLKKSIRDVIATHCKDLHNDDEPCVGDDYMRQWDFSQHEGSFKNHTCKVALVSQRERGGKTNVPDETYLFRTYDHPAPEPESYISNHTDELNPGSVFNDETRIWEACRATSAAPLYFNKKRIMNVRYMDGGVGENNPAFLAATEALQMDKALGEGRETISLLISVGTGQPKAQSRFGTGLIPLLKLLKYMRKTITETGRAHTATDRLLRGLGAPYFRFDVPSPGLSKMKLDECKVKKKKKQSTKPNASVPNGGHMHPRLAKSTATNPSAAVHPAERVPKPESEQVEPINGSAVLDPSAREPSAEVASVEPTNSPARSTEANTRDTSYYNPEKFRYKTFEKIESETNKYCNSLDSVTSPDIQRKLTEAAKVLVYYRIHRERDMERWEKFTRNPSRSPP